MKKTRAPRNRTLTLASDEKDFFVKRLKLLNKPTDLSGIRNEVVCGDLFKVIEFLPKGFADLVVVDPPYNLDKNFDGLRFNKKSDNEYYKYLAEWFPKVVGLLKPTGSLYLCGDWKCTIPQASIMAEHLVIRNRITWQREKGRGAKYNWKNCTEDIWFGTVSDEYYFNVGAVKQKRRVIAPYKENGSPKDWEETEDGNFRLTHPSNFWDDITIPYWSMPENTDHPTQKPEKLLAKLILASCPENGFVFDPFLGSGTTAVVAKKLGRQFCGVEISEEYCALAMKRLEISDEENSIQGYNGGVFWERNTLNLQVKPSRKRENLTNSGPTLFGG